MGRLIELDSGSVEAIALDARAGGRGLAGALEHYAVALLVLLAVVGFGLRAGGISEVGLAEDEVNKVEAVRAYARGDITQNAEHPMVMKTLIFVSMGAARAWNEHASVGSQISDEAALRFPNVVFGALTVFPIFLLTVTFFDRRTALLAAALWATGINAITYNRIAKEDTLLVFFMLFAFYFYMRAKQTSGFDTGGKRRNYMLSGASFGLMFASKYFPHYFGLNMLYHHFARMREREPGEPRGSTPPVFYAVVLATFLLANPAVLFPQTWAYLNAYSNEQLLTHHGYLIGERLYDNVMSKSPFGATPVYFYLLFLLVKTPLPLLFALMAGLVLLARRWREPGPAFLLMMFILWIAPYSLAGAKWLRYTLSLMPFVYMISAVGIAALARWMISLAGRGGAKLPYASSLAGAAVALVFVAAPAWAAFSGMPHYALYTNALAPARAGYFFPHDEFYDDGLREAVKYVCEHAPAGATIAHETPGAVRYYLEKFGRTDLR
ncbi:MAG: glycosyltransferase family 39 protein, partial [Acidobacteria bacterium]|nr:glycosyltransferase family 39 protein [Acidobacteriota bacterium]